MTEQHYVQEETDEGLKFAHLLLKLIKSPDRVTRKEWDYLDSIHIGMIEREAGYTHAQALHVANQIDRIQAYVSSWGRMEFLSDALMMWLIGAGFILAGVLLALLDIPNSLLGRTVVPCSLGIGTFFLVMPFIGRKKAFSYNKDCFEETLISILGVGLLKRCCECTEDLIRRLSSHESKEVLVKVVEKFLESKKNKLTKAEELSLLHQLLGGFGMTLADLPFPVVHEISDH